MKTLKELWEANDCKPFWANDKDIFFYCAAMNPNGFGIGWDEDNDDMSWRDDTKFFPCEDPTKPKPKMRVWRDSNRALFINSCQPNGPDRLPAIDVTKEFAEALRDELGL